MGMRELAIQAMGMRNANKTPAEIRVFLWDGVNALGLEQGSVMAEHGDEKAYEMRLGSETIAYSERDGYSYRTG